MSEPLPEPQAFWYQVDDVILEDLVATNTTENGIAWSYDGKHVVRLPNMLITDVLELCKIHKLFVNLTDSFHNVHLYVEGDQFNMVETALKPYILTHMDKSDIPIEIKHDYTLAETDIVSKVLLFNDHADTLIAMDLDFDYGYLLTRNADNMTLAALDYMLKGLAATIDVNFYFDTVKLVTCDPYTLIHVKREWLDAC